MAKVGAIRRNNGAMAVKGYEGEKMKKTLDMEKHTDDIINSCIRAFQHDNDSYNLITAYMTAYRHKRPIPSIVLDHLNKIFIRYTSSICGFTKETSLDELFGFKRGKGKMALKDRLKIHSLENELTREIIILKRVFSLTYAQAGAMVDLKYAASPLFKNEDEVSDIMDRLINDKLKRRSFTKPWDIFGLAAINGLLQVRYDENIETAKRLYLLEYPKEALEQLPPRLRKQLKV